MAWNEEIKKKLKYCGSNVFIGDYVVFTAPELIELDDNVRIDPFTLITTGLKCGSYTQICSHAVLGGGSQHTITLDGWNFIGYGSQLFCGSEDYSGKHGPVNDFWGHNMVYHGDICFEKYAGVASQVIVLPGITLPEGCTIGAQSLVHSNMARRGFMPYSVYMGSPCQFVKHRDKKGIELAMANPDFIKQR